MGHLPAGLNLRQIPLRILNRHGLPDWKLVLCQEKVQIKYNQFSLFM